MLTKRSVLNFLFVFILVTIYSGDRKIVPATGLIVFFILTCILFMRKLTNFNKIEFHYCIQSVFWLAFLYLTTIYSPSINYGTNKLLFLTLYTIWGIFLLGTSTNVSSVKFSVILTLCLLSIMYISFGTPLDVIGHLSNRFYRLGEEATSNPIVVGRGMGMIIILLIFSLKEKINLQMKFFILALIIISSVYMVSTGSKGPVLSLIASFMIVYVLLSNHDYSIKYKLCATVSLVVILFFVFHYISNGDGFLHQRFLNEGSSISRISQYDSVIKAIINSSIQDMTFGHGLGSYSYLSTGMDIRDYPHNLMLEVLYETGVIGLILIVVMFSYPFVMRYIYFKKPDPTIVLFVYYIINAQFSGDLLSNPLWIVFGFLTLSIIRHERLI
jgi:O-antigen ligase